MRNRHVEDENKYLRIFLHNGGKYTNLHANESTSCTATLTRYGSYSFNYSNLEMEAILQALVLPTTGIISSSKRASKCVVQRDYFYIQEQVKSSSSQKMLLLFMWWIWCLA